MRNGLMVSYKIQKIKLKPHPDYVFLTKIIYSYSAFLNTMWINEYQQNNAEGNPVTN